MRLPNGRLLLAALIVLGELPILLPILAGALITGAICLALDLGRKARLRLRRAARRHCPAPRKEGTCLITCHACARAAVGR